jgi:hypothetical protein
MGVLPIFFALYIDKNWVYETYDGTFIAYQLNKLPYSPIKPYACHQYKYQSLNG